MIYNPFKYSYTLSLSTDNTRSRHFDTRVFLGCSLAENSLTFAVDWGIHLLLFAPI